MIFCGGKLVPNMAFSPVYDNNNQAAWPQDILKYAPLAAARLAAESTRTANTIPKQLSTGSQNQKQIQKASKKRKADEILAPATASSVADAFDVQALEHFWLGVTSLEEARAKGQEMVTTLANLATRQREEVEREERTARERDEKAVKTVRVGLHRALDLQLVYKNNTMKLSAEMPNVSPTVYEAMARAGGFTPKGKTNIFRLASQEDVMRFFGEKLSTTLCYGNAKLEPKFPLEIRFDAETGVVKATGRFELIKSEKKESYTQGR